MAKYTNRTCHSCGLRLPQPNMVQKEIYVETGKSKGSVSDATWVGALMGNKQSVNSLNRWIFNTSQRTYLRKKQVWLCPSCAGSDKKVSKSEGSSPLAIFIGLIIMAIFFSAISGESTSKNSSKSNIETNAPADK